MQAKFDHKAFIKFHLIGLSIILFVYLSGFWLMFNISDSVPHKIFIGSKYSKVNRGDYVLFNAHVPGRGKVNLVKRVAGIPGDIITVDNNKCFVNDKLIGHIHTRTMDGKSISAIKATNIDNNKLFLAGAHPRSFDSRYAELGLIDKDKVKRVYAVI